MTAVGGLVLALVCLAVVALALGVGVATLWGPEPHWLTTLARTVALATAGFCFLLAAVHQLAEALLP
ncbi:hypothetical protein AB0H77_21825 [Streptomyces sp. NPDC050844]|uniref:hypothetical protein n=1 Tax=Streptomyces sp. NPDC050844 TaxID=3155790 RepID=UPI0033DD8DEB